jgi:hypothetical protein
VERDGSLGGFGGEIGGGVSETNSHGNLLGCGSD